MKSCKEFIQIIMKGSDLWFWFASILEVIKKEAPQSRLGDAPVL